MPKGRYKIMSKRKYIKFRLIQIALGLVVLAISALIIVMAQSEPNNDATAVLFTIPLGLWFIFSREIIIYH